MQLTEITLYKNVPISTFNKTIHFKDNATRDAAFDSGRWQKMTWQANFNFMRDRLQVDLSGHRSAFSGFNYGSFVDEREGIRYYFIPENFEYINDEATRCYMSIDTVMTFTQGDVLKNIGKAMIHRQHLPNGQYQNCLDYLRSNGDILQANSQKYIYQKSFTFKDFYVVFQCSNDLGKSFGTQDKPEQHLSEGATFDRITSPVNLYLVQYTHFNEFMKSISDYPWIGQNISNVIMVPTELIKTGELVDNKVNGKENPYLKRFKNGGMSADFKLGFKMTWSEMLKNAGIDFEKEPHLARSGIITIEATDFSGQHIGYEPFKIPAEGIDMQSLTSLGYENQISIFPLNYGASTEVDAGGFRKGAFLNVALTYNQWNQLPTMIDNYKLSMASNANKRELAQDRLFTGRVKNMMNTKADTASRLNDLYALTGGGISIASTMGKLHDEYEFYRDQKAEFADLKLASPSVSSQTNTNTFAIANSFFGFTVKVSAPSEMELNKIRTYYNLLGFEFNQLDYVHSVQSMTICNYLQISGGYKLTNMPVELADQLRALLELGVEFWHDDGTTNPFDQDITKNTRR